jgi:hypothetical protein
MKKFMAVKLVFLLIICSEFLPCLDLNKFDQVDIKNEQKDHSSNDYFLWKTKYDDAISKINKNRKLALIGGVLSLSGALVTTLSVLSHEEDDYGFQTNSNTTGKVIGGAITLTGCIIAIVATYKVKEQAERKEQLETIGKSKGYFNLSINLTRKELTLSYTYYF